MNQDNDLFDEEDVFKRSVTQDGKEVVWLTCPELKKRVIMSIVRNNDMNRGVTYKCFYNNKFIGFYYENYFDSNDGVTRLYYRLLQ